MTDNGKSNKIILKGKTRKALFEMDIIDPDSAGCLIIPDTKYPVLMVSIARAETAKNL